MHTEPNVVTRGTNMINIEAPGGIKMLQNSPRGTKRYQEAPTDI